MVTRRLRGDAGSVFFWGSREMRQRDGQIARSNKYVGDNKLGRHHVGEEPPLWHYPIRVLSLWKTWTLHRGRHASLTGSRTILEDMSGEKERQLRNVRDK